MKRKVANPDGLNHFDAQEQAEKRRRCNERTVDGLNDLRKRTSVDCEDDSENLLEDMGVNIIEDASNDSVDLPTKRVPVNAVLKSKDQNARKCQPTCSNLHLISGMGDTRVTKQSLQAPCKTTIISSRLHHDTRLDVLDNVYCSDKFLLHTRRVPKILGLDSFNRMSDEIVLLVFKWLPKGSLARCSVVCKRWHRLSKDESLWKRVDLGLKNIRPGVIGQVLSRGCTILRLARSSIASPIFCLPSSTHNTPHSPISTFSSLSVSKLRYLDLSMATLGISCLEKLLNTTKHLKKLALERCDVSEEVLKCIGNNTSLQVLHLALCTGFTSVGVSQMLKQCCELTELNISWTDLAEDGIQAVVQLAPSTLERICLAGYRDFLQDEHVETLVKRCNRLLELDVSDSTKITSLSLRKIMEHLLTLESLSTSRCYSITPASYLLLSACPSLLYLNMYGLVKQNAIQELRERLEGIEINSYPLSSIARPTIGIKRTSIWNLRVRD